MLKSALKAAQSTMRREAGESQIPKSDPSPSLKKTKDKSRLRIRQQQNGPSQRTPASKKITAARLPSKSPDQAASFP